MRVDHALVEHAEDELDDEERCGYEDRRARQGRSECLTRQSAANRSLKRDSLLTGKRTGNFVKIGPFGKKPPVRT